MLVQFMSAAASLLYVLVVFGGTWLPQRWFGERPGFRVGVVVGILPIMAATSLGAYLCGSLAEWTVGLVGVLPAVIVGGLVSSFLLTLITGWAGIGVATVIGRGKARISDPASPTSSDWPQQDTTQ